MRTMKPSDDDIRIRDEFKHGDPGRIITLHGEVYGTEFGYPIEFEAFVARTVATFVLDDGANGRIWFAERGEDVLGCAAIVDRPDNMGQLRWVVVHPKARGLGLGRKLLAKAMDYCTEKGFRSVYLETTDGLEASRHLYDALGFEVIEETTEDLWDGKRAFIVMEKKLKPEDQSGGLGGKHTRGH